MSTKIYNGYRFDTADFFEVHRRIEAFKEVARVAFRNRFHDVLTEKAVRYVDAVALDRFKGTDGTRHMTPLTAAWESISTSYKNIYAKGGGKRDPWHDFDAHISVFPTRTHVLAMFYCEGLNKKVVEAWENIEGIEYYGYWNNVDPPEDVSEKDWEARGKEWDEVLTGFASPAVCGYTTEVNGIYGCPFPEADEVVARAKTPHERALSWAVDVLTTERLQDRREFNDDEDAYQFARRALDTAKKIKQEEQDLIAAKANELLPLIPVVTKELLLEKLPIGEQDV